MDHARLSPSASHRWLTCPASVLLTDDYPDDAGTSPYAEEGTKAHRLAELNARLRFGLITEETFTQQRAEWEEPVPDAETRAEMEQHVATYIAFLAAAMAEEPNSSIMVEQRLNTGVPGCWGTTDAVIVSPRHVHVVDFKYGQGVPVSAEGNSQLMLYGVGALDTYDVLGGIGRVTLSIVQPRLDNTSTWTLSAADLRTWREEIRPVARAALSFDDAWFGPSETACRFCPARGECKPRQEYLTQVDFGNPAIMSGDELSDALGRVKELRTWLNDLETAALTRVYSRGEKVPGYKVVRSQQRRTVTDQTAAVQTLIDHGWTAEQVARLSLRTFGDLEKLMGREMLHDTLGDLIGLSEGKPTLAPESDARPSISPVDDFDVVD